MEPNDLKTSELTVISSEVKIVGTLEVRNELHLYGQILGELHGHSGSVIYLKEGSLIEGKISADTLIVEGFVKGEIRCQTRLWVAAQGRVVGSIHSPSLQVDPGAVFEVKVSK